MAHRLVNGGTKRVGGLCLAFAAPLLVAAVWGQSPRPTVAPPEAQQALHRFAVCMARQHAHLARWLIAAEDWTVRTDEGFRMRRRFRYAGGECYPAGRGTLMRADSQVMRGALAEQLYLVRYRAFPADVLPSVPDAPAGADLLSVTACAAARVPEAVDALMRTPWNSPGDSEAMAALRSTLAACRGAVAPVADESTLAVRTALATALYLRAGRAS